MRMLIVTLSIGIAVLLGTIAYFTLNPWHGGGHGTGQPVWTVEGGDRRQGRWQPAAPEASHGLQVCCGVWGEAKSRPKQGSPIGAHARCASTLSPMGIW